MSKKSRDEMKEMWRTFKKTNDPELRNQLVEHYYPLVRYSAERLKGKLPQCVDIHEMISAGVIGLINAIDKFEPERNILFETYCSMRIRGAILDDLRATDWVPRLIRSKSHKLEKARLELAYEFGREPEDEEIAAHMGLDKSEYFALLKEVEVKAQLPIENSRSDGDDDDEVQRIDLIEDRTNEHPLERLSLAEIREVALRGLSDKESKVISMYYFDNRTMKDIGKTLKISESRVCQIHTQVVKLLKQRFVSQDRLAA